MFPGEPMKPKPRDMWRVLACPVTGYAIEHLDGDKSPEAGNGRRLRYLPDGYWFTSDAISAANTYTQGWLDGRQVKP